MWHTAGLLVADINDVGAVYDAFVAGHQQLGNLILLYDANHISIEGDVRSR